jgi:hypothetical protein
MQIAFRLALNHTLAPSRDSLQMALRRLQAASLILATFGSCVSISRADRAELNRVSFRVMEDSVWMRRSSQSIAFDVDAVVRNDTRRPLLLDLCGIRAQRQIGAAWQTVWVENCLTPLGFFQSIPAGGSRKIPVAVYASLRPNVYPQADPRLNRGRYRLLLDVAFERSTRDSSVHAVIIPPPPRDIEFSDVRPSSVFVVADSSH